MARKESRERRKASKAAAGDKRAFMSDRQKRVLLGVLLLLVLAVPIADNIRCKSACMKRVKTPYPEIACRYECPWPWQKGK